MTQPVLFLVMSLYNNIIAITTADMTKFKLFCCFHIIFLVSLRCATSAVGVLNVTGYLRREVNISCSYDPGYESYEKYLCKNSCGRGDVLITTTNPVKYKYMIHDDKIARIFSTTISDLRSMDAGKYWCGVKKFLKDVYTEVELKLVKGKQKLGQILLHTESELQGFRSYS